MFIFLLFTTNCLLVNSVPQFIPAFEGSLFQSEYSNIWVDFGVRSPDLGCFGGVKSTDLPAKYLTIYIYIYLYICGCTFCSNISEQNMYSIRSNLHTVEKVSKVCFQIVCCFSDSNVCFIYNFYAIKVEYRRKKQKY